MLRVIRHDTATEFLDRTESWLLAHEAEHNIILSVAYLLRNGAKPFLPDPYLASINSGDEILGVAMHAPPDGVYITDLPDQSIPLLTQQLRAANAAIAEVSGPTDAATTFAREWGDNRWKPHSAHFRYSLETVIFPANPANGLLRKGTESDDALLRRWGTHYGREVGTKVDVPSFFLNMVERDSLYIWEDGEPRCVVTASGHTQNGARISATYTPPEFRGNGYAKSAVAAASQKLLSEGKQFCVISADKDDPIPNAIYRKIGYQPISEFVLIHFT